MKSNVQERSQVISDSKEENDKLKGNRDEFTSLRKNRKNRKNRITPYTVAGGDPEGKVTYTYPTGDSEDY